MKHIPHLCHLIWDHSPMALLNVFTVVSFHRQNPDWKIIVYKITQTCDDLGANTFTPDYIGDDMFYLVEELDYVQIKYIDLKNYGVPLEAHPCQGSDVFRRNILYQQGGVYSDFDTLWIRSIDHIKDIECIGDPNDFESIVSYFNYTHGFHNVSNIISEPGSEYLWSLMKIQATIKPPFEHQAFGSDMLNKAYPTLADVTSKYPRILALKYETFYPYSTFDMGRLFIKDDLSPMDNNNVLGIHWFFGNSITKDYLNRMDYQSECSMNTILRLEGYMK